MRVEADRYRWDQPSRRFHLVLDQVLVDVNEDRSAVTAARVARGWQLITTKPITDTDPLELVDLWAHPEQPTDARWSVLGDLVAAHASGTPAAHAAARLGVDLDLVDEVYASLTERPSPR